MGLAANASLRNVFTKFMLNIACRVAVTTVPQISFRMLAFTLKDMLEVKVFSVDSRLRYKTIFYAGHIVSTQSGGCLVDQA